MVQNQGAELEIAGHDAEQLPVMLGKFLCGRERSAQFGQVVLFATRELARAFRGSLLRTGRILEPSPGTRATL